MSSNFNGTGRTTNGSNVATLESTQNKAEKDKLNANGNVTAGNTKEHSGLISSAAQGSTVQPARQAGRQSWEGMVNSDQGKNINGNVGKVSDHGMLQNWKDGRTEDNAKTVNGDMDGDSFDKFMNGN